MSDNAKSAGLVKPALGPYRYEQTLFGFVAFMAVMFWLFITLGTLGIVWIYMIFIYIFVLVAHSALISHLKGNSVRIDAAQFPELHQRIQACAAITGVAKLPECYLMSGNGILNAFATRFLRRYYVVLLSDVVDALEDDQEALNFYIGHELGHIARKHVAHQWWIGPVLFFPLVGAAYRRAQEYTCDQYGAACCNDKASAGRAVAVLAAGTKRWKALDPQSFINQMSETSGFWMSLNELTSEYPWLCKRMARIYEPKAVTPSRHPMAWFLAAFMPGGGAGGLMISMFMMMMFIGIIASVSIPALVHSKEVSKYPAAFSYAQSVAKASQAYYEANEELASSPDMLTLEPRPDNVRDVTLDSESGEIIVTLSNSENIIQNVSLDENDRLVWSCYTSIVANDIPKGSNCGEEDALAATESVNMMDILKGLFSK